MENKILELRDFLQEKKRKIIIIPHISPDGDAAGSCSALYEVLRNNGHVPVIMTCDFFPDYLKFLPHIDQAISLVDKEQTCISLIKESELVIMVDHNTRSRAGNLAPILDKEFKGKVAMIDHHLEPDDVDFTISESTLSSTCEILYGVINGIWGEEAINKNIANALYTGINTDTGGLSYNSSRSSLYRIIADLLDCGLDKEYIHDRIYRMNSLSRLRLVGHSLQNKLVADESYPLAIIPLTQAELKEYNYVEGDLEGLVNIPLSVSTIEVSVQVVERSGRIKLSFRSKKDYPVNEWSKQYFSGGGHRNAAGGQWFGTLEEAIQRIHETKAWFFDEYNKNHA